MPLKDLSPSLSFKAAALDPDAAHGLLMRAKTYQNRYMRERFTAYQSTQFGDEKPAALKPIPNVAAEIQKAASLAKEALKLPSSAEMSADACEIIAMNSSSDGVTELTKLIEKYPKYPRLYVQRSECYTDLKKINLAAKDKKTAAELNAATAKK